MRQSPSQRISSLCLETISKGEGKDILSGRARDMLWLNLKKFVELGLKTEKYDEYL